MAWLRNRKTGKVFNTDWLDAEAKLKYAQIQSNKQEADRRNKVADTSGTKEKHTPEEIAARYKATLAKKNITSKEHIKHFLMDKSTGYINSLARDMQIPKDPDANTIEILADKIYSANDTPKSTQTIISNDNAKITPSSTSASNKTNFLKSHISTSTYIEYRDINSGWKVVNRPRLDKTYIYSSDGIMVKVIPGSDVEGAIRIADEMINKSSQPLPPRDSDIEAKNEQEYKNVLGSKNKVNPNTIIDTIHDETRINPHYRDYPQPKKNNYHNNCALCTVATVLQARGYDVEAAIKDERWRGSSTVFDIDYTDTDNYVLGNSDYTAGHIPTVRKDKNGEKYIYTSPRQGFDKRKITGFQTMPRGASAVARTIDKKMKEWGNGAIAELIVSWSGSNSWHSVAVVNNNGWIYILDSQTNKTSSSIEGYLLSTNAIRTNLIRLDNVPLKSGVEEELKKMVKKRTPGK